MANPSITALPEAPQRRMARDVYPVVADKWAAALGPFASEMNQAITWMGNQATDVTNFKDQAAASAKAAAKSVTDAASQVDLATTQAGNAKTSADAAKASADSAQVFAAAAGSAAGLGSLAGNAGKAIVVDANEKSVSYQDVGLRPGDYLYSAVNPGPSYLPAATGQTLNQASYPKLFARIGTLIDWSRVLSSLRDGTMIPQLPGRNGNTLVAGQQSNYVDLGFLRSLDGGNNWSTGTVSNMSGGNGYYVKQVEYFAGKFIALMNNVNSQVGYLVDPTAAATPWTYINLA
uniref:hypothetical protein n=1 Tax=uncultured Pseudomonas sp. TaxID=114707 RepID=UPI00258D9FD1